MKVPARHSLLWLVEAGALLGAVAGGMAYFDVSSAGLNPHPYGLVVLVIALHYGTIRGAVVASAATVLLLRHLPAQGFGQDYNLFLLGLVREPLLWCALVLLVGGFTDRQRGRRDVAEARAEETARQLAGMVEVNEALLASHRALEAMVAAQRSTPARIFEAARGLGHRESSVVAGTLDLLKATTGATSGALHLLDDGRLTLAAADGDAAALSQAQAEAMIAAFAAGRDCLVATRADDRAILDGAALLAAPLHSPDGSLSGILTITALPFRDLGPDTIANLVAVCGWVGHALALTRRLSAAEDTHFATEGRFVGSGEVDAALDFMVGVAMRFDQDLASVEVVLQAERADAAPLLAEAMKSVFPNADVLLQARREGTMLQALLLGPSFADVSQAEARLRAAIAQYDPALASAFSIRLSCLHSAQRSSAA